MNFEELWVQSPECSSCSRSSYQTDFNFDFFSERFYWSCLLYAFLTFDSKLQRKWTFETKRFRSRKKNRDLFQRNRLKSQNDGALSRRFNEISICGLLEWVDYEHQFMHSWSTLLTVVMWFNWLLSSSIFQYIIRNDCIKVRITFSR